MNLPDITRLIYDAKEKERKIYPCHSNRASELGHPCERYLVYNRMNWQDKSLHSVETQFIFDGGNVIEKLAKEDLEKAGFEIIEQHRPYEWKEYQITGYIDFMLRDKEGFVFPVEVKGLQDIDANKLNCIEDFLQAKKIWLNKYPAQLTLYMLLSNKEYGAFYIKGKPSLLPKHIWINLDYTFAESLLKKAERINNYIKGKSYPEKIEYKEYICGRCDYAHICLPDTINQSANFIDSSEIEEKLIRREELKKMVSEYEELDEEIKDKFKGVLETVIGENWHIISKLQKRKSFTVPESESWVTSIKKWK